MSFSNIVVLDRDGVINYDSDDYIKSVDEWIPLPGSIAAICNLSKAGFKIFVATNQSGIGRGYFDEYTLSHMHQLLYELVEQGGGHINGIFYCPHTPAQNCDCRKPATGLLDQIEQEFSLSLENAWYVGDAEKDIDVALAKKCRPILVKTGKGELTIKQLTEPKKAATFIVDNLYDAANQIIKTGSSNQG